MQASCHRGLEGFNIWRGTKGRRNGSGSLTYEVIPKPDESICLDLRRDVGVRGVCTRTMTYIRGEREREGGGGVARYMYEGVRRWEKEEKKT